MAVAPLSAGRDPELAGGLLRGRARFHLGYRVLVRLYGLLADPDLVDRTPAAALSFAGDVGWFVRLQSSEGEYLVPRVVHDTLDVAYWSAVSRTDSDHATLIAVPLTIEVGARHGARALALPVVIAGAAALARRAHGRRTSPMYLLWPTAGVLAGIATARNARRQDEATIAEQSVVAEARAASAYVAGQNAVAMGADSVVDLLTRTEPLLRVLEEQHLEVGTGHPDGSPRSGTARALSAWKSELATSTAGQAAYLGTLLTRWGRSRSAHDLSRDLVLDLSPGAGTALISATQAEWITRRLDELGLEGMQNVAVPDGIEPGSSFVLGVGHHLLDVPADPEPPVRGYEHAPVLLALGGLWSVVAARKGNEDAGWAVLPGTLGSVGLALWAHLRVRSRRPAVDARLLGALMVLGTVHGVTVALLQRRSHDERGLPLFPQLGGPVTSLALLASQRTPRRFDPSLVVTVGLVAASTLPGFAAARLRGPVRAREVAVASLNLLSWWVCMWGSDDDLEQHRADLVATFRDACAEREARARDDGRDKVRELVDTALRDCVERYDVLVALVASLPVVDARSEALLAEVGTRLAVASDMLADLAGEPIGA